MFKKRQLKVYDTNKMREKKKARQIKESHSEGDKLGNVRLITKDQSKSTGRTGKNRRKKRIRLVYSI